MAEPDGALASYAAKGERFEDTVVREVREETGLEVQVGELAYLRSGYRLRVEVAYEAAFAGGTVAIDSLEILEARWCSLADLPEGMQESHRLLILGRSDQRS